jgi:hypothetical protein
MRRHREEVQTSEPSFLTGHGLPVGLPEATGRTSSLIYNNAEHACEESKAVAITYADGHIQQLPAGEYFLGYSKDHTVFYLRSAHSDPVCVLANKRDVTGSGEEISWVEAGNLARTHKKKS